MKPKKRKQQAPPSEVKIKITTTFPINMRLIYTRSVPRIWNDELDELEENATGSTPPSIYH
ncbi:MAG: hypothetical protein ACK5PS_05740 [Desulfopila sp.]